MPKNKKSLRLLTEVTCLFLIGILATGVFTFFTVRGEAEQSVKAQMEKHGANVAEEVRRSVAEYPAYRWLLQYWYRHAGELDIEYDVGFTDGTQTEEKCRRFTERHPALSLRYVTDGELEALPEEDRKLYAEIAYAWLLARVDQIKQTYGVDYLFFVVAEDGYGRQVFLFSAAEKGANRGTTAADVYILGKTVTVEESQAQAMREAAKNSSHLADAGKYVDYYTYFEDVDGAPALIGLTYSLKDLRNNVTSQTLRGTFSSVLLQVALSALCLFFMYFFVLRPLKKIQSNIRGYRVEKDSAKIKKSLAGVRSLNELGQLAADVTDLAEEIDGHLEDIRAITAEKERIGTEMGIASQIQEASLPTIFPPYPDREEFDIYASMTPAKEVGGDFYDFFLVDGDHLALVMADVSGKGVPAALFMMVTKILLNERTLTGGSPGEILSIVNDRICAHNKADMFVTVWLGILEISTGKIIAANAGHDDPAVMGADGKFKIVKNRHGPVVGAMDGVKYKNYEMRLSPGDKLFLYTDGVPEATDAKERMFGMDNMLEALNENASADPKAVVDAVWERVDAFVGDAPQFDDVTMLCLELKKCASEGKTLEIPAHRDNLPQVNAFTDAFLEALDCPLKIQTQIDLCVEEIFVNVASYAYPDGEGTVRLTLQEENGVLTLVFADRGRPFDPLAKTDPDLTLSAEDRPVGGLGVFIVKKTMDEVTYRYEDGENRLTMKKRLKNNDH